MFMAGAEQHLEVGGGRVGGVGGGVTIYKSVLRPKSHLDLHVQVIQH